MTKNKFKNFLKKPTNLYHPSVFEENLTDDHPYPDFKKAYFSWIAPEYLVHAKSFTWWVVAGLVWFVASFLEAATGNWTFFVATVLFGLIYWYSHHFHPPRHFKINISALGIKVGHRQIPYSEIESFWIIYDPPYVRKLYFRLKNQFFSDLVIELMDQNPESVKAYLERNLPEVVDAKEDLSDVIIKLLKL